MLSADGDRIAIGLEEGLYVIEVTRDGECAGRSGRPWCRRQGQHWECMGINMGSLDGRVQSLRQRASQRRGTGHNEAGGGQLSGTCPPTPWAAGRARLVQ